MLARKQACDIYISNLHKNTVHKSINNLVYPSTNNEAND